MSTTLITFIYTVCAAICAIVIGYRINKWTDKQLFKLKKEPLDKDTKGD